MGTIPTPHDNLIERAEAALRAFEGDDPLTREQAQSLLSTWRDRAELSASARRAVLARFPRRIGHAWWSRVDPAGEQHIWTCTCSYVVVQAFGAPVPDELIGHPQDHGQLRGHDLDER